MGNCIASVEEREATGRTSAQGRTSAIDRQLREDRLMHENTIKTPLLGAGESGKSTLVKQIKIIHGDGYSQKELQDMTPVIYSNFAVCLKVIVQNMSKLGLEFADPRNKDNFEIISRFTAGYPTVPLPPDIVHAIKSVWADDGVKECFKRAYKYQLNDSAPYYLSVMDRILADGYVPTEMDVLHSRVQTTGIIETAFKIGKLTFRVVDVGGQRSERRKWIQTFDDIRSVWFVCALSGYDMTLFEDGKTNRLEEALNLFQAICNNKFFVKTNIILFLNKVDLFKDKIMNSDRHLRLYFSSYIGEDGNVEKAVEFIKQEFMQRNLNKSKTNIYTHLTTATDTSNIKTVMKIVADTILHERLQSIELL